MKTSKCRCGGTDIEWLVSEARVRCASCGDSVPLPDVRLSVGDVSALWAGAQKNFGGGEAERST